MERKIRIIICLFDFPGFSSGGIWKDYRHWEKLIALWSIIATRYRSNPFVIGYDLMNEPSLVLREGTALDRVLMQLGTWTFPRRVAEFSARLLCSRGTDRHGHQRCQFG